MDEGAFGRRGAPQRQTFGRRGEPRRELARAAGPGKAVIPGPTVELAARPPERPTPLAEELGFTSSADDDFEQWKRERREKFEIPWRPLSVLASLFFGVASFALPDSVNDNVDWLLYALAAASLWAGFRRRRRAKS